MVWHVRLVPSTITDNMVLGAVMILREGCKVILLLFWKCLPSLWDSWARRGQTTPSLSIELSLADILLLITSPSKPSSQTSEFISVNTQWCSLSQTVGLNLKTCSVFTLSVSEIQAWLFFVKSPPLPPSDVREGQVWLSNLPLKTCSLFIGLS